MANQASRFDYGRRFLEIGIVLLLYFGAARLCLLMAFTHRNISPVWVPSGIALAALLIRGIRVWPAILLGAFLANYSTLPSFPVASAIGIGNTLEALAGAFLLRRMGFQYQQGRLRDTLGWILMGAIVSPTVAATIGVASLWQGGFLNHSEVASAWGTWWLGDGMGILVVTPVILIGTAPLASWRTGIASIRYWRVLEALALMLALVGITQYLFHGGQEYPYAVFPCLVWAAMRFGQRGATVAILVVSGLAIWGTLWGLGPFVRETPEQSLEYLQTFMGVVAITTLVLAAAVTERDRSEQRQAQLLEEVQHQRKRFDDLLATVPALIWEAYGQPDSATQRIDFVSHYVESMLGYGVEEWLAQPNFWLTIVHPEDQEQAAQRATEAFESGMPHRNQFRWIAKDGRIVWTEARSIAIRGAEGRSVGMRGINIDVTDRKQAEEERERLVQELQRHQQDIEGLNERLRRAMAETHHRVKNNLQVICALIEIQIMKGQDPAVTNEFRRLSQHVRSLAILHDLLTYEAKSNASADNFGLKEAMQQLMPLLQNMVGDRNLRFSVDDARVPVRQGTALTVLVNELVSNAVKHGAGDIDLSLAVVESDARLEVCDCGPGFPPEFDPQRDSRTGMELIHSLSTWDLGGQVAFENRPEGGARVVVTFPLARKTNGNEATERTVS